MAASRILNAILGSGFNAEGVAYPAAARNRLLRNKALESEMSVRQQNADTNSEIADVNTASLLDKRAAAQYQSHLQRTLEIAQTSKTPEELEAKLGAAAQELELTPDQVKEFSALGPEQLAKVTLTHLAPEAAAKAAFAPPPKPEKPAKPSYTWAVPPGGKVPVRMTNEQAAATGALPAPSAADKTAAVKTEQAGAKYKAAMDADEVQGKLVDSFIDEALANTSGWTAGFASNASSVKGTPAYDLNETINSIKANVGFDALSQMRQNSPTGGALGNVSDRENTLLAAIKGSLSPGQSPAKLKANLLKLKANVKELQELRRERYAREFGNAAPASATVPSGEGKIVDFGSLPP